MAASYQTQIPHHRDEITPWINTRLNGPHHRRRSALGRPDEPLRVFLAPLPLNHSCHYFQMWLEITFCYAIERRYYQYAESFPTLLPPASRCRCWPLSCERAPLWFLLPMLTHVHRNAVCNQFEYRAFFSLFSFKANYTLYNISYLLVSRHAVRTGEKVKGNYLQGSAEWHEKPESAKAFTAE